MTEHLFPKFSLKQKPNGYTPEAHGASGVVPPATPDRKERDSLDTVLSLDHVSKVYHNGRGAKNISFSVARGQVVGLLGPNGSGKTTIMKSITGLSQPSEGSITVFDAPSTDREASLKHVGALIEQPALYENLTAWDHLVMAARFYPAVDEKRMDQVLTIVGLAPYKKERCGKFSLGMKQRMGIALALLSEPTLMILDEPTNGLDIEATVEIREIIIRLAKEKGVTFLVASHLASEIEKMCDKVLVLYEGEMLSFDTKEEALRLHPSLEDYFLAKVRDKKGSVVL